MTGKIDQGIRWFQEVIAGDVLARANAVQDGVYTVNNDNPTPSVDQATLQQDHHAAVW